MSSVGGVSLTPAMVAMLRCMRAGLPWYSVVGRNIGRPTLNALARRELVEDVYEGKLPTTYRISDAGCAVLEAYDRIAGGVE